MPPTFFLNSIIFFNSVTKEICIIGFFRWRNWVWIGGSWAIYSGSQSQKAAKLRFECRLDSRGQDLSMEEAGGWSKGRKTFQKRQDLSQTRGVGRIGAVLVSQSIVSAPFFGAEIPLGNWGGGQTYQTHVLCRYHEAAVLSTGSRQKQSWKDLSQWACRQSQNETLCQKMPKQYCDKLPAWVWWAGHRWHQ